jgi:hypothetical protein
MTARPERDLQKTPHCFYSIPCECGRSYIGETGRLLIASLRARRHNLKDLVLKKSKLVLHAYEEYHGVGCDYLS